MGPLPPKGLSFTAIRIEVKSIQVGPGMGLGCQPAPYLCIPYYYRTDRNELEILLMKLMYSIYGQKKIQDQVS